jgi:hypothetical protein
MPPASHLISSRESLVGRNVRVLTLSGDDLTDTDDKFKVAMRGIAGAFAQPEKAGSTQS